MNTDKKVELLFWDCHSSVEIKHNNDTGMFTLCITEYEIDQSNSTEHETNLKRASVTEIFLGAGEIDDVINALEYIRTRTEVI